MMPAASSPKENAGPGQHALIYAGMGWRVLPIKPGEKRPPMSSWQHAASTDHKVIVNWFKGLYQNHGCGIATGEESGLWVLDIDVGEGKAGVESLAELEQRHGPLPTTVEAVTGSGGRHLYFTWPPGRRVVTRRDTGATDSPLPAGIDVRGEGGQVLAPPTVHPNGSVYRWRDGCAPWDREIVDAPEWLLAIVCEREAPSAPPPPGPDPFLKERRTFVDDDSIAEWHNQRTDWAGTLAADGWTALPPQGDQQYWVRPGKQKKDGHSAVLHLPDGPFVIFSTDGSLSRFAQPWARNATGDGWAFSKFGYEAARHHGGDRSAAARRLREIRTEYERRSTPLSAEPGDDTAPAESSWRHVDLADYIEGNYEPVLPAMLLRADRQAILYAGRVNGLFGESGAGKSWIALLATAERLMAGEVVVYIDLEDHPPNIIYRLRSLGVTTAQLQGLRYVQPDAPATADDIAAIDELCAGASLVVIDSLGEATAMQGVEENRGDQYAVWNTKFARHWARLGPAVLTLDHLPKSEEAPSLFAVGTQRKKAAIDGVLVRVDQVEAFDKKKAGRLKLTCAKDRNGTFHRGEVIAECSVAPGGDAVEITLGVPAARDDSGRVERPTFLMERVSRWIEIHGPASGRAITDGVEGKAPYLRKALDVLVAEGWVTIERRVGRGGGNDYASARAFREENELLPPVDNPEVRTASNRVPTASRDAEPSDSEPRPATYVSSGAGRGSSTDQAEPRPELEDDEELPF